MIWNFKTTEIFFVIHFLEIEVLFLENRELFSDFVPENTSTMMFYIFFLVMFSFQCGIHEGQTDIGNWRSKTKK